MSVIEKARKKLNKRLGTDPEQFHRNFDDLLEERLRELDPEFMTEMDRIYDENCGSRWFA